AFKIRAVPVNVNYRYVAGELRSLFNDADLVALVHQRAFGPRVAEVAGDVPTLRHLLYVEDPSGEPVPDAAVEFASALTACDPGRGFAPRSADDRHVIYTGGTTGAPRGVVWRHEDLLFAGMLGGNPLGPPSERPEEIGERAAAAGVLTT